MATVPSLVRSLAKRLIVGAALSGRLAPGRAAWLIARLGLREA